MARILRLDERDPEEATFGSRVEYTRRFLAVVDDRRGAQRAIYEHGGQMRVGSPHPHDSLVRVREVRIVQLPGGDPDHGYYYDVEVSYDSDAPERRNPLMEPAKIEWSTAEVTRVISQDANGRPLLNTAGSPILDVSETYSTWAINVEKNVEGVPAWIGEYANAVNSDAVVVDGFSCAPRTLRMTSLRISEILEEDDVEFRRLQFSLLYQAQTWDRLLLNQGYYEIVRRKTGAGLVVEPQRIVNEMGEPIDEPAFLDEHGRRPRRRKLDPATRTPLPPLPDGSFVEEVKHPLDPDDILILRFETLRKLPFRVLPLT